MLISSGGPKLTTNFGFEVFKRKIGSSLTYSKSGEAKRHTIKDGNCTYRYSSHVDSSAQVATEYSIKFTKLPDCTDANCIEHQERFGKPDSEERPQIAIMSSDFDIVILNCDEFYNIKRELKFVLTKRSGGDQYFAFHEMRLFYSLARDVYGSHVSQNFVEMPATERIVRARSSLSIAPDASYISGQTHRAPKSDIATLVWVERDTDWQYIEYDLKLIHKISDSVADDRGLIGQFTSYPKRHPSLGVVIPNGFKANVYEYKTKGGNSEVIIAFAGTALTQFGDLVTDIEQLVPIVNIGYGSTVGPSAALGDRISLQYKFADKYYRYIEAKYPNSQISVCGHSLGGGLASYVALKHRVKGYGFNSATLLSAWQDLVDGGKTPDAGRLNQVRSSLDPVSGFFLGKLPGTVYVVDSKAWPIAGFVTEHFIDNLDVEHVNYVIPYQD
jgi:hypothetical protein